MASAPAFTIRVPDEHRDLIRQIAAALKNDPTLSTRLTALLSHKGETEGEEPRQAAEAESPPPTADDEAPVTQKPADHHEPEASRATQYLEALVTAITEESARLAETRALLANQRSELELVKAELREVVRLRANLADLRTRLGYAECSLYDLGSQLPWQPEGQATYRFHTAIPDTDREGGYALSTLGYASPVAAVAAVLRSGHPPTVQNQTQIYDAHTAHWLGSMSELVPPDRMVRPERAPSSRTRFFWPWWSKR